MPKPKGKAGSSKGHNKNFKRRPTPKSEYDHIPESAIDREPDNKEPEDDDPANSKTKIGVPVAMWVCGITPYDDRHDLPGEVRILGIVTRNAARGRNSLALG